MYHIAPLGEFAHAAAGVVQVLDAEACTAMAARFAADAATPNFPGLLIDFDHLSMDSTQRSEAAGWITGLEARVPGSGFRVQGSGESDGTDASDVSQRANAGLWAQIRWSDIGEEAVKGGRYRFLSPVWSRSDCVELGVDPAMGSAPSTSSGQAGSPQGGWPRMRPVRLLNAAVTNDPNLKGMRPLSNRSQESEARSQNEDETVRTSAASVDLVTLNRGANAQGDRGMKSVIEKLLNHLGLAADATEAAVLEKLGTLPAVTVVTELQNSLRDLQTKHDALVATLKTVEGELVNRHLAEFEGIVTEKSRDFWAAELISNRAGALTALAELASLRDAGGSAEPEKVGSTGPKPLHNRATARPVPPGQGAAGARTEGDGKAMKIRNRAHEIAKAEAVPFSVAFRRAEREVIGQ